MDYKKDYKNKKNGDLKNYLDAYKERNKTTPCELPLEQQLDWVYQLVNGLKYLESQNTLHRDIKPR